MVVNKYPRLLVLSYNLGPLQVVIFHLGALLPLMTGLSWQALLWGFMLYVIRMLGITGIYHRLIIHKSYQAPKIVKWVGSFIASSAGQMGPNWWKGHHIQGHHNHSDMAGDRHSPHTPYKGLKGFLWAQFGWLMTGDSMPHSLPADVEADWGLKLIDRLHFVPLLLLGAVSFWMGGLEFLGAFFLSTTILFHGVALVNSLAHTAGEQPFTTTDYSRNNWFVAVATLGEGWHNLHHAFQWSARHGFSVKDGKVVRLPDPTYWFILLLEKLHLASDLKLPSEVELLQAASETSALQKA
ncbi:MAG: acyl-CoA desaturase [Cyanobacteria bacterium Co-bin13]|nr:acyl-CoA desaturase [Cyanobacteria bacterium Co-bin13]